MRSPTAAPMEALPVAASRGGGARHAGRKTCRAPATAHRAPIRIALFSGCCVVLFGGSVDATKWLSLGHVTNPQVPPAGGLRKWCNSEGGAETAEQRDVCAQYPYIMTSIARGAALGLAECAHQFHNSRWNCSTAEPHHRAAFSEVLKQATRETGFVHAVTAAAVAHAVTKACSQGALKQCGCDSSYAGEGTYIIEDPKVEKTNIRERIAKFRWGGCTDNVAYGVVFSRAFIDSREAATARGKLNLHNNEAGRKVVEASMGLECKCHGISGSCEYKTCWKALQQFRHIGDVLKSKFDGAKEVVVVPRVDTRGRSDSSSSAIAVFEAKATKPPSATTSLSRPSSSKSAPKRSQRQQEPPTRIAYRLVVANPRYLPPTDEDIVYSEDSPNHCDADVRRGSLGTRGRSCERLSHGVDGCDLMCCGRGYTNKKRRVEERCDCKFHWCCEVRCKTCTRDVEEHHCL